jgi:hypothetical protein
MLYVVQANSGRYTTEALVTLQRELLLFRGMPTMKARSKTIMRLTTKPIRSWEVIERSDPLGYAQNILRIAVTYPDGRVRIVPGSFKGRIELDRYVTRFHVDFAGKEVSRQHADFQ